MRQRQFFGQNTDTFDHGRRPAKCSAANSASRSLQREAHDKPKKPGFTFTLEEQV